MNYNISSEVYKQQRYHQAWRISLKYSVILMNNVDKYPNLHDFVRGVYKQYISELNTHKLVETKDKKYIQVWNTVINTLRNNNTKLHKGSIKLLHQTNIQRVDRIR